MSESKQYDYDICADVTEVYHNTFNIWKGGTPFPDLNGGDGLKDDDVVTDFIEMQRKANAYPKLVELLNQSPMESYQIKTFAIAVKTLLAELKEI